MTTILYEISYEFNWALIIPIIIMVAVITVPIFLKRAHANKLTAASRLLINIFSCASFLFVAMLYTVILVFRSNFYEKTLGAYERGEYEIVEGYVENFVPMPYTGHSQESFEIDEVKFHYSDYSEHPGYNNTRAHGGIITGNGQHLKIGYIYYNSTYGNVIVYIEQLP